jgi:integrase
VKLITDKANLDGVAFHTLRHAFASLLIVALKEDVETVSRQLGHSSSAITLSIYSHEFEKARSAEQLRQGLSTGFEHLLAASS